MRSRAVGRFWRLYDGLPVEIRHTADKQFALWLRNPRHRSLRFKQVRPNLWSARVTDDYRALATRDGETFPLVLIWRSRRIPKAAEKLIPLLGN